MDNPKCNRYIYLMRVKRRILAPSSLWGSAQGTWFFTPSMLDATAKSRATLISNFFSFWPHSWSHEARQSLNCCSFCLVFVIIIIPLVYLPLVASPLQVLCCFVFAAKTSPSWQGSTSSPVDMGISKYAGALRHTFYQTHTPMANIWRW